MVIYLYVTSKAKKFQLRKERQTDRQTDTETKRKRENRKRDRIKKEGVPRHRLRTIRYGWVPISGVVRPRPTYPRYRRNEKKKRES